MLRPFGLPTHLAVRVLVIVRWIRFNSAAHIGGASACRPLTLTPLTTTSTSTSPSPSPSPSTLVSRLLTTPSDSCLSCFVFSASWYYPVQSQEMTLIVSLPLTRVGLVIGHARYHANGFLVLALV
jgi:hypothetical protein